MDNESNFKARIDAMNAAYKAKRDKKDGSALPRDSVPSEIRELVEAVETGNQQAVKALLDKKYVLDHVNTELHTFSRATNTKYDSLMEVAVANGKPDMAKLLIERGVKIRDGETIQVNSSPLVGEMHGNHEPLLIQAVKNKNRGMVDLLLNQLTPEQINLFEYREFHKDTDRIMTQGKTALMLAVESGDRDLVGALLAKGANPDLVTDMARYPSAPFSALSIAAHHDDAAMVQLLIDHGATFSGVLAKGDNPLMAAVKHYPFDEHLNKGTAVVEKLLELYAREHLDQPVPGIDEAFAEAIASGHPAAKLLVEKGGAKPDAWRSPQGYTALERAIAHDNREGIITALACGADINLACETKDVDYKPLAKYTPLELAMRLGKWETVSLLVEKGARTDIADAHGDTPLIQAVQDGRTALVKLMLEQPNANPDQPHAETLRTPLMEAIDSPHDKANALVTLLLAHKAKTDLKDKHGDTALHHCGMLIGDDAGIVANLIKAKADPNLQNNDGDTPLMVAIAGGHTHVALELLKVPGIKLDLTNTHNQSALSLALDEDTHMVEQLLKNGATADVKDSKGNTLSQWLGERREEYERLHRKPPSSDLTSRPSNRLNDKEYNDLIATLDRIQAYAPAAPTPPVVPPPVVDTPPETTTKPPTTTPPAANPTATNPPAAPPQPQKEPSWWDSIIEMVMGFIQWIAGLFTGKDNSASTAAPPTHVTAAPAARDPVVQAMPGLETALSLNTFPYTAVQPPEGGFVSNAPSSAGSPRQV